MFKSKLFKPRRVLLGNCIFGILYVAIFALINFAFLNFNIAMVISIIFATGVLKPVCWILKVDNVIRRYVDNRRIQQETNNGHLKLKEIQCNSCYRAIDYGDTYIKCKEGKIFCDLMCSFDCELCDICEYDEYTLGGS